jgi:phosphohistidine phosphatase
MTTIYLVQHGLAAAAADDPARPLTPAGRDEVARVARRAGASGVRLDSCVHSGKLRARQTAELLAAEVGPGTVQTRDGLAPDDPVAAAAAWLRSLGDGEVAVVGHLPHLDRLASLLVAGDPAAQVVRFRNAGLVALVPKRDADGFRVAWVIVPETA